MAGDIRGPVESHGFRLFHHFRFDNLNLCGFCRCAARDGHKQSKKSKNNQTDYNTFLETHSSSPFE